MTALLSAELLRLRTVRAPRYGALGFFALMALLASITFVGADGPPSMIGLRGFIEPVVFTIAIVGANGVGAEFKLGTVARTYLVHPARARVTAVHVLVWGAFSAVLSVGATGLGVAIALAASDADPVSGSEVARLIAGAGLCGAIMGAAGVLIATVTREASIASIACVTLNIVETAIANTVHGTGPYLPLSLCSSVMGLNHDLPGAAAAALLLFYLGAIALAVRIWALPRDLT